jgi:hypothetical protein
MATLAILIGSPCPRCNGFVTSRSPSPARRGDGEYVLDLAWDLGFPLIVVSRNILGTIIAPVVRYTGRRFNFPDTNFFYVAAAPPAREAQT